MLQRASLNGLIVQGGVRSNQPVFMLLGAPHNPPLEHEVALAELARRYFSSRGPASLQDFNWWSGLSAAQARAGIDSIRSELLEVNLDGWTGWQTTPAPAAGPLPSTVYLLPGFDEYLLAYKDRSASLDVPQYKRQTPTNGMLPATIVVDGRVAGTWKRIVDRRGLQVVPDFFEKPTEADRDGFEAAAGQYADFLGLPLEAD
jgi:hypothetical protein